MVRKPNPNHPNYPGGGDKVVACPDCNGDGCKHCGGSGGVPEWSTR